MEELRYPIGRFELDRTYTPDQTRRHVQEIAALPSKLFNLVHTMTEAQLETPYRPEGWTVRQTVHHIADSHINSYCRFHLALTENNPTIRPYEEQFWAELPDGQAAPVDWSLQLLKYLHIRWVMLLNSLSDTDWERTFVHPSTGHVFNLREAAAMYAWHSEHHYEHIRRLAERGFTNG